MANLEEREMDERGELSPEELEGVSGGFEFTGSPEWLRGTEIVCPYCGNSSDDVVKFKAMSPGKAFVHFICNSCRRTFNYSNQSVNGKILLRDDKGKVIN